MPKVFSQIDFGHFKNVHFGFAQNKLAKKLKKVIVTIMLSFPFFLEKCCDANFFRKILFIKKMIEAFFCHTNINDNDDKNNAKKRQQFLLRPV